MTDIEIAKKSKIKDIRQVAESLNIGQDDLILYGNNKAKIKLEYDNNFKTTINGTRIWYERWRNRWRIFTSSSDGRY